MSDKTCGECKHFFLNSEGHCKSNDGSENAHNDACTFFEPKVITNGDRIISGGMRALAEFHGKLACDVCEYKYEHRCIAPQGKPLTCGDGIEAWLNAPAGNYTNVPTKESEVNNGFAKCEYCGKTYRKKKKAQRFCSIKCKDKWWNRERAGDREYLHPQCEDNFNGEW